MLFLCSSFLKGPWPLTPALLAGLNSDLFPLAIHIAVLCSISLCWNECESGFMCFPFLKGNNPALVVATVLRNLSSFYCCLQQEGESNVRYSIVNRAESQEISYFKRNELKEPLCFSQVVMPG